MLNNEIINNNEYMSHFYPIILLIYAILMYIYTKRGGKLMILNHDSVIGFIGTYTKNESEGIYKFSFNSTLGKFEKIALAYKMENPTYLAIDDEINVLYSTCKIDAKSGISSFKFWKEKDHLDLINHTLSTEEQPCHITISGNEQILISSNYHENKVLAYKTLNGIILNSLQTIDFNKFDVNTELQCSILTRDEKYLVSLGLGIDKLIICKLQNGELIEEKNAHYNFPPGTGPKYITYCKNNNTYYVISEYTSEIFIFHYSPSKECPFSLIQTINILPHEHINLKSGATIHIHKNNKFLYACDKGNNSISLFHINNSTGKLKYISIYDCNGIYPIDLKIDPTGKYLLCANEKSNNISIFSINKLTGELKFINTEKISAPSSIEFCK